MGFEDRTQSMRCLLDQFSLEGADSEADIFQHRLARVPRAGPLLPRGIGHAPARVGPWCDGRGVWGGGWGWRREVADAGDAQG